MTVPNSVHNDRKQVENEARGGPMEQRPAGANAPSSARDLKPLDQMRAYRACLNCRSRKSKCDLDINGGSPVSLPIFVDPNNKASSTNVELSFSSIFSPTAVFFRLPRSGRGRIACCISPFSLHCRQENAAAIFLEVSVELLV